MEIKQNDREYLSDRVRIGAMTADKANVEKVRMQRVLMINGSLPRSVRSALNMAVKEKYLAHMARDGIFPEVYYHPEFEYMAVSERKKYAKSVGEALRGVLAN
jgi:hypothetical protein